MLIPIWYDPRENTPHIGQEVLCMVKEEFVSPETAIAFWLSYNGDVYVCRSGRKALNKEMIEAWCLLSRPEIPKELKPYPELPIELPPEGH